MMAGMGAGRKQTTAFGRCLSIVAGWVVFSLAFGLLSWADNKTGLTYHVLEKYRSLSNLAWDVNGDTSIMVAEWIVRSFVCSPAILIGLMFYEHYTAGIPTFSIRSALVATALVAVLLWIGAGNSQLVPRWRPAVVLFVVIAVSSIYLTWALVHKQRGSLADP